MEDDDEDDDDDDDDDDVDDDVGKFVSRGIDGTSPLLAGGDLCKATDSASVSTTGNRRALSSHFASQATSKEATSAPLREKVTRPGSPHV